MYHLSHVGPLQLDKRFSSPQEVRTYFGLPVELRCAFKYGAEPVRVGIFRGDLIIAGQENGTKKVKISVGRKISDFGSYTCRAEDSKNQKLIYNIMLKKIGEYFTITLQLMKLYDKNRICCNYLMWGRINKTLLFVLNDILSPKF